MAWIPCVRKAEEGSAYCRRHGDAIYGAMLGALVNGHPRVEVEHFCGEKAPCPWEKAGRGGRKRRGRDVSGEGEDGCHDPSTASQQ